MTFSRWVIESRQSVLRNLSFESMYILATYLLQHQTTDVTTTSVLSFCASEGCEPLPPHTVMLTGHDVLLWSKAENP